MSGKVKAFNPFVRAKHSGLTPYRPNFNLRSYKRKVKAKRTLGFTETEIPSNAAQGPTGIQDVEIAQDPQVKEPPKGFTFQRNRLTSETQRLTLLADKWSESANLPEHLKSEIDAVVGGTRLLISSKFRQFSSLIDNATKFNGEGPAITADDLDGFWDMMSIQIRNLDSKFERLETSKQQGWPAAEPSPAKSRKKLRKAMKPKGVSKFKDFLLSRLNH